MLETMDFEANECLASLRLVDLNLAKLQGVKPFEVSSLLEASGSKSLWNGNGTVKVVPSLPEASGSKFFCAYCCTFYKSLAFSICI